MFGRTEFYAFEMSRKRKANDNLLSCLPRDVC